MRDPYDQHDSLPATLAEPNPYDQFDAPTGAEGNIYDQFDMREDAGLPILAPSFAAGLGLSRWRDPLDGMAYPGSRPGWASAEPAPGWAATIPMQRGREDLFEGQPASSLGATPAPPERFAITSIQDGLALDTGYDAPRFLEEYPAMDEQAFGESPVAPPTAPAPLPPAYRDDGRPLSVGSLILSAGATDQPPPAGSSIEAPSPITLFPGGIESADLPEQPTVEPQGQPWWKNSVNSVARGASSEGPMMASEGIYHTALATIGRNKFQGTTTAKLREMVEIGEDRAKWMREEYELDNAHSAMPAPRTHLEQLEYNNKLIRDELNYREGKGESADHMIRQWLEMSAAGSSEMRRQVRDALPVDDAFANSTLGGVLQGVGQLTMIPAYGFPGLGPLVTYGQVYQEARDDYADSMQRQGKPVDEQEAHRAAVKYVAGALPMEVLTDKLIFAKALKPLEGKVTMGQLAKTFAIIGSVGGGTESGQQWLLNQIAKNIEGYDPERKLDKDVLQSLIVGGIVSGGGGTIAHAIAPRKEAPAPTKPAPGSAAQHDPGPESSTTSAETPAAPRYDPEQRGEGKTFFELPAPRAQGLQPPAPAGSPSETGAAAGEPRPAMPSDRLSEDPDDTPRYSLPSPAPDAQVAPAMRPPMSAEGRVVPLDESPHSYKYVSAAEGRIDWGDISEKIAEEAAVPIQAAPIRVQAGFHNAEGLGFGWVHAHDHEKGVLNSGWSNMRDFLADTLGNFNQIWLQPNGRLLLVKAADPKQVGVVELQPSKGFYGLTTAYPERKGKDLSKKATLIWERSEPVSTGTGNPGAPSSPPAPQGSSGATVAHGAPNQLDKSISQTPPRSNPKPRELRSEVDRDSGKGGGISPRTLAGVIDYGRSLFFRSIRYVDWARRMVRDLGGKIDPHLRRIWQFLNEDFVAGDDAGSSGRNFPAGARPGIEERSPSRPRRDAAPDPEGELRMRMAEWKRRGAQESIREEAAASRIEALREKLNHTEPGASLEESLLGEIADFGHQIGSQGMDYFDWSMRMARDLGDRVIPHLRTVFEATHGRARDPHNADRGTSPGSLASPKKPDSPPSEDGHPDDGDSESASSEAELEELNGEIEELFIRIAHFEPDDVRTPASEILRKRLDEVLKRMLFLEKSPWYSPESKQILKALPVKSADVPGEFRPFLETFGNLGIPGVWTSEERAEITYDPFGNLTLQLPRDLFERGDGARQARVHANAEPFAIAGEELGHGAILSHLRDEWIAGGSIGSFMEYVKKSAANAFADLRETIRSAPPRQRDALTRAVRDSHSVYFAYEDEGHLADASLEDVLDKIQEGERLTSFVFEFVRQAVQLRRQGHISEAVGLRIKAAVEKIYDWIRPALARLRRSLPRAYQGEFGTEIQRMIEITDSILDGFPAESLPPRLEKSNLSPATLLPRPEAK